MRREGIEAHSGVPNGWQTISNVIDRYNTMVIVLHVKLAGCESGKFWLSLGTLTASKEWLCIIMSTNR